MTLLVDTRYLEPLPQAMWDIACSRCDRRRARWQMTDPKLKRIEKGKEIPQKFSICAICFLYASNWGLRRRKDIDALVVAVEKEKGVLFSRDIGNRLVNGKDADLILGSIAYTSRRLEFYSGDRSPQ